MCSMVSGEFEKWNQLKVLKRGTTVKTTKGEEYIFIELNQKDFVGIKNGVAHNVPVKNFDSVIKVPDVKQLKEYKQLKAGELFYIYHKSEAMIYIFQNIDKNGNIVGINPVSRLRIEIDPQYYAGRVKDIRPEEYISKK